MIDSVSAGGVLYRFKKREIPGFFTEYFWSWLEAWLVWRDKGMLPLWGKGWYEHPQYFIETIRLFDRLHSQRRKQT